MPRRGKRAARQAELGEEVETAVAVYLHDPDEADDVADDLRDGIRDMVCFGLGPGTVWKLQWSTAGFPTIMDIEIPEYLAIVFQRFRPNFSTVSPALFFCPSGP